jgi:hypothetical protein
MRTALDRFDRHLRAELRREFDSQDVTTPAPDRARYGRLERRARRQPSLRTVALVTAVFTVGILVGLGYGGGRITISSTPGRHIGPIPAETTSAPPPSDRATATATARPTPRASSRPSASTRPSAPPSAPAALPAFADDFSGDQVGANPPGGWHVDDGQWAGVVDDGGHMVRHGAGQDGGHLVAGSSQWSDYAVRADVSTGLLSLGFAGVAGRYQDPGNDYECGIGVGSQLQLSVVKGGQRRLLGASGVPLDLSGRHTVALEMRGSQLTCSLDGAPLLRAVEGTFSAGRVALVASAGEAAEFGGIRVTG